MPMDSLRRRRPRARGSREGHVPERRHWSPRAHLLELRRAGWTQDQVTELGAVHSDPRLRIARSPIQALRDRANTVLPGIYAWVTTVALPSVQHTAPALARVTAFL